MTYRRIYAFPDIHGRDDRLEAGLELIHKDGYRQDKDHIMFMGDYIDRGPDSQKVIDIIKGLVDLGHAEALAGNHERFATAYYSGTGGKDIWMMNGGFATLSSYGGGPLGRMTDEHIRFLGSLPLYREMQGFFFSHAPVPREKHRNASNSSRAVYGKKGDPYTWWELTWYYFGPEGEKTGGLMDKHEGPLSQEDPGVHLIGLCGHIHRLPATEVRIFPKYRMLDAGCGCSPDAPLAIHECVDNRTLYVR